MQLLQALALLAPFASFAAAQQSSSSSATSSSATPQQSGSPTAPSKDPWYTPSGDWQSAEPGAILNSRDVPHPIKNLEYQSAHQILYRTTDSLGNASYATTTVIIPQNANFSQLLSYQIYYDTPDVDCSPSYTLQVGGLFSLDQGFNDLLGMGAVVNTPDYEGPLGAFVAGVQAGQATLDSIRAVLSSQDITGVQQDAQTVMWGYSGGALASEWAAELQPSYAPELEISGAALGGLTPNVTSVALTVNNKTLAGLIPAGIIGLTRAYPNVSQLLNDSFTSTENRDNFFDVQSDCIAEIAIKYADTNYLDYFKEGAALLFSPPVQSVANAGGQMGLRGTPSIPLYVYKSTGDDVSPVADTDKLVNQYCLAGTRIQYIRDDFGSHTSEGGFGVDGAMNFLQGIFNGTAQIPQGCVIKTLEEDGSVASSSSVTPTATPTPVSGGSGSGSGSGSESGSGSGSDSSGTPTGSSAAGGATNTGAASKGDVNVKLAGLGLMGGLLLL